MLISKLYIDNFRNFSQITLNTDNKCNYIVGDNGIGKSNILELINTVFSKNFFLESDFNNADKKIEVVMTLNLSESEQGYFSDLFDPEDEKYINIYIFQDSPTGRIEYRHLETNTSINYSRIRNIPCVYYNSVQSPQELNFSKGKTAGRFLNSIINTYIENQALKPEDIVKEEKILQITEHINSILSNISIMNSNDISTKIDNNSLNLIPKLIGLSDKNNMSVNSMGSGIVYMSYIFLEILNTITNTLKYDKSILINDKNGKKHLPIMIVLDEPEIHLHPYMQRAIIKQVNSIINNKDVKFSILLKSLFDIDFLQGQIIVATHSANILSDNYKEYIRLYKSNNELKSISGNTIDMEKDYEKHLLQQAALIKEAFFAKVVTIFEGISDTGTIPYFASKLGIDFDEKGIGIIAADGEGSVRKLKELLEKFDIKVVAVLDNDSYTDDDRANGILSTKEKFLECDIVNILIENRAIKEAIKIIKRYDMKDLKDIKIQKDQLEKYNVKKKLNIVKFPITKDYTIKEAWMSKDADLIKLVTICWFCHRKDMIRGRIVGEILSADNIPNVYKDAISKAKELAENV